MPKAATEAKISDTAFRLLNDSSDSKLVEVWSADEAAAQAGRNENPASMDIFDIKPEKGEWY